jgi:hypothetical protein
MKSILFLILMVVCAVVCPTAPPAAHGATNPPPESVAPSPAGADTTDPLLDELEAQDGAGNLHNKLETSVFRRERPVQYTAYGRDPFRALISDEKKTGEVVTDLLRTEGAVLTGVVWSEGHYLAMVKDKDSKTFFLREGDRVYQGRVMSVTQSQIVMDVSDFGDFERVTLKVKG